MACVIAAGQALGTGDLAGHRAARAVAERCLRTVGKKDLVKFCGPLLTGKANPDDPQGFGTVQVGSNVYSEMRAACAAQPDVAAIRRWASTW